VPGSEHRPPAAGTDRPRSSQTFLTNHGHLLLAVSSDPDVLVAGIAE
jgi:hypothetical protein